MLIILAKQKKVLGRVCDCATYLETDFKLVKHGTNYHYCTVPVINRYESGS